MTKQKTVKYKLFFTAAVTLCFVAAICASFLFPAVTAKAAFNARIAEYTEGSGTNTRLSENYRFVKVVSGVEHTVALTATGSVYVWGKNTRGQLGFIVNPLGGTETQIAGLNISQPTLLIDSSSTSQSFTREAKGAQSLRQAFTPLVKWPTITQGDIFESGAYQRLDFSSWCSSNGKIKDIAALEYGTVALTTDNSLVYWGDNSYAQFGLDFTTWIENEGLTQPGQSSYTFTNKEITSHTIFGFQPADRIIPRPRVVVTSSVQDSMTGLAGDAGMILYNAVKNELFKVKYDRISAGARHFIATGVYTQRSGQYGGTPGATQNRYFTFGDKTYGQAYESSSDMYSDNDPGYKVATPNDSRNTGSPAGAQKLTAGLSPFFVTSNTISTTIGDLSVYAGANSSIFGNSNQFVASGKNFSGYLNETRREINHGTLGIPATVGYTTQPQSSRFYTHSMSTLSLQASPYSGFSLYNSVYANSTPSVAQPLFATDGATVYDTYGKHRMSVGVDFGMAVDNSGRGLILWGKNYIPSTGGGATFPTNDGSGIYTAKTVDLPGVLKTGYTIKQVSAGRYPVVYAGTGVYEENDPDMINAILTGPATTSNAAERAQNEVWIWGTNEKIRFNVYGAAEPRSLSATPLRLALPGNPSIVSVVAGYGKLFCISELGRIYIVGQTDSNTPNVVVVDAAGAERVDATKDSAVRVTINPASTASKQYFKAASTKQSGATNGMMFSKDGDALRWAIPRNKTLDVDNTNNKVSTMGDNLRFRTSTTDPIVSLVADSINETDSTLYNVPNRKVVSTTNTSAAEAKSLNYKVKFYPVSGSDYAATPEADEYAIDSDLVKSYVNIGFAVAAITNDGAINSGDIQSSGTVETAKTNGLFTDTDLVLMVEGFRRCRFVLTAYIVEYDKYSPRDYITETDSVFFQVHEVSITFDILNSVPVKNSSIITDAYNNSSPLSYSLDANVYGQIVHNGTESTQGDKITFAFSNIVGNTAAVSGSRDYYAGLEGIRRYATQNSGVLYTSSDKVYNAADKFYYDYLVNDADCDVLSRVEGTNSTTVLHDDYFEYLFIPAGTAPVDIASGVSQGRYYGFDTYYILTDQPQMMKMQLETFVKTYAFGSFRIGGITVDEAAGKVSFRIEYSRLILFAKKAIPLTESDIPSLSFSITDGRGSSVPFEFKFRTKASTSMKKFAENAPFSGKLKINTEKVAVIGTTDTAPKTALFYLGTTYDVNLSTLFQDSTDLYFDSTQVKFDSALVTVNTFKDTAQENPYQAYDRIIRFSSKLLTQAQGTTVSVRVSRLVLAGSGYELSQTDGADIVFVINVHQTYAITARQASDQIDGVRLSDYFKTQASINRAYSAYDFFNYEASGLYVKSVRSSDTNILGATLEGSETGARIKFNNRNTGTVAVTVTVTDGYSSLTSTFTAMSVEGIYVGSLYKINSTTRISAAEIAGSTGVDTRNVVVDFVEQLDSQQNKTGIVKHELFSSTGELLTENPYFTASYMTGMLYVTPIKASKELSAVISVLVGTAEYKVKIRIQIWKFTAIDSSTQSMWLFTLPYVKSEGAAGTLLASEITGMINKADVPEGLAMESSEIISVRTVEVGGVKPGFVNYTYGSSKIDFTGVSNGVQELLIIMYDRTNYYSVNMKVEVAGIVTTLPKDDYILIFGLSALGVFLVLVAVFVVRMIVYSKKVAHQKRIIKKNRMLINLRDRMHNKQNKASKEELVRTKIQIADTKYAAQFDKMRRKKEDETGVLLANSRVAQSAKQNAKAPPTKQSSANAKMLEQMRAKMLAEQAQNAMMGGMPMQGPGAMPGAYGTPMQGGFGAPAPGATAPKLSKKELDKLLKQKKK